MTRALLLHKPGAGHADHTRESLEDLLSAHGYDPVYLSVDDGALVLGRTPADAIIVAGGDGTFSKLMTHLRDRGLPVILMPVGTANNVARSMGIDEAAAALSPEAISVSFDIGRCSVDEQELFFSEAAGLGALASVLRSDEERVPADRKLERGRQLVADAVQFAKPFDLRLETGDGPVDGPFLAVEFLNTRLAGPSLLLAGQADPTDGQLDLFCIRTDDREPFLTWLGGSRGGPAPRLLRRVSAVHLNWDRRIDLRIDDRLVNSAAERCSV